VPLEQLKESPFEPIDPARFSRDLAGGINRLLRDDALRQRMSVAGRRRVEERFSWAAIAEKTAALYETLVNHR
jgi:glycosyltransferase involved in cell wall biosynthesis